MRRFEVADDSMRPDYQPGDYLVAAARPVRRGDVVVFPSEDRYHLKRVIGIGGDRVTIWEGAVMINDVVVDEPYTDQSTKPNGSWAVPPGSVFVLSDAREATRADSRSHGPIPLEGMSRVLFRYRRSSRRRMPRV